MCFSITAIQHAGICKWFVQDEFISETISNGTFLVDMILFWFYFEAPTMPSFTSFSASIWFFFFRKQWFCFVPSWPHLIMNLIFLIEIVFRLEIFIKCNLYGYHHLFISPSLYLSPHYHAISSRPLSLLHFFLLVCLFVCLFHAKYIY